MKTYFNSAFTNGLKENKNFRKMFKVTDYAALSKSVHGSPVNWCLYQSRRSKVNEVRFLLAEFNTKIKNKKKQWPIVYIEGP